MILIICHDTTLLASVLSGVQCVKCGDHVAKCSLSFNGDSGYHLVGHIQHCVSGVFLLAQHICIRLQLFLTHYVLILIGVVGHF